LLLLLPLVMVMMVVVLVVMVAGVDTATVYTRKDVAGEELEGEPDLLAYIRLPKDLCVALTQETNGSVFRFAIIVVN